MINFIQFLRRQTKLQALIVSLICLLIAGSFVYWWLGTFNHDEFEAMHTGWKLLQGERIFIDFFQHHNPFFYYLLAPIIWIFGENIRALYAAKFLIFAFFLADIFLIYRITFTLSKNRTQSLIAALLLLASPFFYRPMLDIRPDTLQILLSLISVNFLVRYQEQRKAQSLALLSLSAGLSFLVLQKGLFFLVSLSTVLGYLWWKDRRNIQYLFIFTILTCLPISIYLLYLFSTHALQTYFTFAWRLNTQFLNTFSIVQPLKNFFLFTPLLWLFSLVGCLRSRDTAYTPIVILLFGLLGSLIFVRSPYLQYFSPILPFVAIIASYGMVKQIGYRQKFLAATLCLSCVFPLVDTLRNSLNNRGVQAAQIQKIEYVLKKTEPGDRVYDGNSDFNLYRHDIEYFWFSVGERRGLETYQTMTTYPYDIYQAIKNKQPSLISTYDIDQLKTPMIRENYTPSEDYSDLLIRKAQPPKTTPL